MKQIPFFKMSGAGNDFIVIDTPQKVNLKKLARKVCDRTNGIGADGLLVLNRSKKADYQMRIINADGSEAEMCGNGARCMAAYIAKTKHPKKNSFSMDTLAGLVQGIVHTIAVTVKLNDPTDFRTNIPLTVNGRKIHVSYIDTGVPHTILHVHDLKTINIQAIGRIIRYHKKFQPRGTNVNFVEQINPNLINVRTYERGVENETKACGTGSVAAAIVTYLKANPDTHNKMRAKLKVRTSGQEILEVIFDITKGKASNVWLKGSANFIAKGEYYV